MNTRLLGWLALLGGSVWMAFSIKSLHELPRFAKAFGNEVISNFGHDALGRGDVAKVVYITADEMAEKLPHTVVPTCLMLGGGVILGVFRRLKNDRSH